MAVYELGAVFLPDPTQELPAEPLTLGILLAGQAPAGRHDDPRRLFDFGDAKGVVEGLVAALGVPGGVGYQAEEPLPYHPGRCAAVRLEDLPVGLLGQLHPRVAAAWAAAAPSRSNWAGAAAGRGAARCASGHAVALPGAHLRRGLPGPAGGGGRRPGGPCARPAASCWPASPCSTPTEAAAAPGHRNLAYRVALQAPDRTLTDADGAAVRDRMAALAAERRRRSSAPPGRVERVVGSLRLRAGT